MKFRFFDSLFWMAGQWRRFATDKCPTTFCHYCVQSAFWFLVIASTATTRHRKPRPQFYSRKKNHRPKSRCNRHYPTRTIINLYTILLIKLSRIYSGYWPSQWNQFFIDNSLRTILWLLSIWNHAWTFIVSIYPLVAVHVVSVLFVYQRYRKLSIGYYPPG